MLAQTCELVEETRDSAATEVVAAAAAPPAVVAARFVAPLAAG